jgi:hypothetical protein
MSGSASSGHRRSVEGAALERRASGTIDMSENGRNQPSPDSLPVVHFGGITR